MKIGIMGGTFNPIHNGHIEIAKAAYSQYALDEIWFMPNHIPGYKPKETIVSADSRLNMVALAIQDYPYFKVSDFEVKRDGNTYTAETMSLLKDMYPSHSFYFIMGMDSLLYFDKWKNPDIILQYCKILVAPRNKSSVDDMTIRINELHQLFGDDYFFPIKCQEINCSSSEIRDSVNTHYQNANDDFVNNILSYLNPYVKDYILKNKLYKKGL